jgi:translation initiation factor 1 (eIF-1/SUI1)
VLRISHQTSTHLSNLAIHIGHNLEDECETKERERERERENVIIIYEISTSFQFVSVIYGIDSKTTMSSISKFNKLLQTFHTSNYEVI